MKEDEGRTWQWYPRGMQAWAGTDDQVHGLVDIDGVRWFAFKPDGGIYSTLESAFAHGEADEIEERKAAVEGVHRCGVLGWKLRAMREAKPFTQSRIAKWCKGKSGAEVLPQYVWRVEAGKVPPSDALLIVYVDKCGGSMDELVRLRAAKGE